MSTVVAIVPAFNEASNLRRVIDELLALPDPPEVVVIDDASSDDTAEIARAAGARVVRMAFNTGIGATVQTGLRLALAAGYQQVVRVDGDGQHDPADLPALLARLGTGEADFVLGSRYIEREGFQTTAARRAGSRWFSFLLRLVVGLRVTDPTSGFWAANRGAAQLLLSEYASDYPEVDSLIYLSRRGCQVREVPVVMRPRKGGHSSIGGLLSLYYMIKVTVALLVERLRPRA